ncbi:hypothetical protein ACTWJ9_33445 (plasmid) [Streptomyces sp. GDS52]|uniref:hypothetical protein n=1 Tax=Streptomyces sp. GDS52 TaxID=3406419 RepID=UPI003FD56EF6
MDNLPARRPEDVIDAELIDDDRTSLPATRDTDLSPATRALLAAADADNTRAAYTRQWDLFTGWCAHRGRAALPATPETLADYVTHLTATVSQRTGRTPAPASIEQAIAVIRAAHTAARHRDQPDTALALKALKAYKKTQAQAGRRKRKAPPINLARLRALAATCDTGTLAGLRDRTILVLGFAMMARRSELAGLHLEDIREDDGDLLVYLRTSKTDQEGRGAEVVVPHGVHPDTDPVRAVRDYRAALAARGITTGRLLRAINRWDNVSRDSMSGDAINEMLQRRAAEALPGENLVFTAHGLRAGAASEAYRARNPISAIRGQGRWAEGSPQVLEYIRPVDAREENPMRGIGL